jgi:hypothetical protein
VPSRSNATVTSRSSGWTAGDGASGAVLHELAGAGSETAVVAASHDPVADQVLPAGDDHGLAGELAVLSEQGAGSVVERSAGRVRPGDHRIGPPMLVVGVPVGHHGIERLAGCG